MASMTRAGTFMRRMFAPAALAAIAAMGTAQAAWPERTITLIACFPAGGGTDIAARLIAPPLGEALKVPVIVENRGGAGGNIGISTAKRAKPDGYTFLVCSSAFDVNPSLYANPPYDPLKDFTPVIVLGASPNALVTPAQSAFKTLGDLIAKGKAEPGKLNWTSPGAGTTPYLAGELLQQRTGIKMVHIPFQGAGPALAAALGGQVDMYTAALGSLQPMIEAGKLRALAVTSAKRWPDLPNLPTLEEQGVHDATSDTFQGIFAPAGTPQPVNDRMVKEITAILARPDMRDRYAKSGLPVTAEPPDVFRARIARELPMYKEIVDKAGLKIK
ncbi:MAG TPA: tripartite tricarboxylate transporter substrate binding protein [Xanthobacteraceae bacterium]